MPYLFLFSTLKKKVKIRLRMNISCKKLPLRIKITCPTVQTLEPTLSRLVTTLPGLNNGSTVGRNRETAQTNHNAVAFRRVTVTLRRDCVGGNRGMGDFPRITVEAYFPTVIANRPKVKGNRVTVGLNSAIMS